MKSRLFVTLIISMSPSLVLAASGHLPARTFSEHIPFGTVISQIANLVLLVGLIYFSQRKTIAKAFADQKNDFLKSVNQANESKEMAQKKLDEISKRLSNIEKTFDEQINEAQGNAKESYQIQLANAKNEAMRIKESAKSSLEFEIQKEVENLRLETFHKSADLAEEKLEKNLTPEQMKAWTNHFSTGQKGVH